MRTTETGPLTLVRDKRSYHPERRSDFKNKSPGSSRASSPAVHKRTRAA